jgi:hypothetical protein
LQVTVERSALGDARSLPAGHRSMELLTSFAKVFDYLLRSHISNFFSDPITNVAHQFDGVEGFI